MRRPKENEKLIKKNFIYLCLFILFLPSSILGQKANDINQSIIAQAEFDQDGKLTLSWQPKPGNESYNLLYRNDLNGNWQIEQTGITDTFYIVEETEGGPIEFLIESIGTNYAGTNILVGNGYFDPDQEEHMLIIATDSIYLQLASSIEEYRNILELELIHTSLLFVDQSMDVVDVKERILEMQENNAIDYILILGHVPVPYAGDSAIDGHGNHSGAWVADGYYGDLDGNWTDTYVDNITASREANHNVPGDGKFDQSVFPSSIEIPVGRVDFSDLPKLNESEMELTRRYLERNIAYRTGKFKATKRAIIDNNFNLAEGFAQGAIKSFHTFLEPDSISYGEFKQCTSKDYLFTYGAGGGNYQGASGIISTNNLVNDSIQSIFTTVFGSYFGDWDVSNNLLRASLARGSSLINAWSGRPIWYFHHMSMGKTVGHVLLNTQNNNGNYTSQFGKRMCHTSLLGDPSLKMYYHLPIKNLMIAGSEIQWESDESDPDLVGFTVYAKENDENWNLLTSDPINSSSLDLSDFELNGSVQLLVRPVTLIHSRSGSYFNEGSGQVIEYVISNTEEYTSSNRLFPNPAKDYISIEDYNQSENLKIFDVNGKMIKQVEGNLMIDISNLTAGLYYIHHSEKVYSFVKI